MRTMHQIHRHALATLGLAFLVLAGCGSDDPTAPVPTGPKILVLEDGGSEDHVITTLKRAGFSVTRGGLFYEFAGAALDRFDAVVLLTGVDYNHDMNLQGQRALVDFVKGGGGLLTTEWLSFSIERQDFHQELDEIIPVAYGGSYANGSETYTVMVDHPITEGLPPSFATGTDTQFSAVATKSGATRLVRGNRSNAAVATWTKTGRVVSWSGAGEYGGPDVWDENVDQLLVNMADFVSRR